MKASWLAKWYRQVGVGLGFLDEAGSEDARTDAEIKEALAAVHKLKTFSLELRRKGVDARTMRDWITEGRRA